jgi:hypothetical protein
VENDTNPTPFTVDAVSVETVMVLPTREEPTPIFIYTVEPIILDVTSVLPRIVEYPMNPPYKLDTTTVEPINVLP